MFISGSRGPTPSLKDSGGAVSGKIPNAGQGTQWERNYASPLELCNPNEDVDSGTGPEGHRIKTYLHPDFPLSTSFRFPLFLPQWRTQSMGRSRRSTNSPEAT